MRKTKSSDEKDFLIHHHFSQIAHAYDYLRTTDAAPIMFIAKRLEKLEHIGAIDIGCGTGRYDLLLFECLGPKLRLTCLDSNPNMLDALEQNFMNSGISDFASIDAKVGDIPYQDNVYDCVFTFNAVHHFSLLEFLLESARILKVGGYIFIYTRLPDQNRRNIWGRYFPMFNRKETRLYRLKRFTETVAKVPRLHIESVEYYKYPRMSTLTQLIERARARHYSTFSLYTPEELEEAIEGFTRSIKGKFKDLNKIHWCDEYTLFVIGKR